MRFMVVSSYGYWGNFMPQHLEDGTAQIGGGETAMLSVSRELAALGHEVIVFYDVAEPCRWQGVDFLPMSMFVPMSTMMTHDVLAAWDAPYAFRFAVRSNKRVLVFQLNNAEIGVYSHVIDKYFHPSAWHAKRFAGLYPEIEPDKQAHTLTNGVSLSRYVAQVDRDPYRVIYSSSPDRGLHHLLRVWPDIKRAEPRANLHIYYDMLRWFKTVDEAKNAGWTLNTTERADLIRSLLTLNEGLDVFVHGGVGQAELAKAQLSSHVMCYPCDPVAPTEGFSMSCLEGLTAGCELITTNADALGELWSDAPGATVLSLPTDGSTLVAAVLGAFERPLSGVRANPMHLWQSVAKRWEKELS